MTSTILSIQSAVAYGHVGNSAATFPLQRAGHEVWPVSTVNFSNHTGYGAWRGPQIPAAEVADIITGIQERGVLGQVDAVLSGYQGGTDIADVIIEAVAKVKAENPKAIYACDPVMGNAKSGCHVDDSIPPLLRDRVVPVADMITPNQFELGFLTGREDVASLEATLEAVAAAQQMGPHTVLVTSVERPDRPEGTIEMLAVGPGGKEAWLVQTPHLPFKRNGSGDVTAALFTGHLVRGADLKEALEATASSVFDLVEATYRAESPELELIAAQDAFATPRMQFSAVACG